MILTSSERKIVLKKEQNYTFPTEVVFQIVLIPISNRQEKWTFVIK